MRSKVLSILSVLGVVTVGTAAAAVNTHVAHNAEKKPEYQPSLFPTPTQTIYRVAKPTPQPTQTVIVTTEVIDPVPVPQKSVTKARATKRLAHHGNVHSSDVNSDETTNPYQTDEATPSPTPSPSHTKSSGSQYSSNENWEDGDYEQEDDEDDEYEHHKEHHYEDYDDEDDEDDD